MKQKQSLASWIQEALTDREKEGECIALNLVYITSAGDREIHGIRLGNRAYEPDDLARQFQEKANHYAQELPGVHYFALQAFYGSIDDEGNVKGGKEPLARHPFRVTGELEFGDGFTSEAPDERGVRQQAMRLTEQLVGGAFGMTRIAFDNQNQLLDKLVRLNMSQGETIEKLVNGLQGALLQRAQENHTFRLEEIKAERMNNLMEKGMALLPGVTNKLLGKEVFPETAVDSNLLELMVGHLMTNPEKARQLQGLFPQEIMAPLMARAVEIAEKKQKTAQLHAKVEKNPEDDAGGA